ncbi:MAG: ComEC/Rec2 family competence protein [Bacteroidales bacterium]
MSDDKAVPCVRIALPLMAGILAGRYVPLATGMHGALFFISGAVYIFSLLAFLGYRHRYVPGFVLNLVLILFGMQWAAPLQNGCDSIGSPLEDPSFLVVSLPEPVLEKERSYGTVALVAEDLSSGDGLSGEKILIYFEKDSLAGRLEHGDILIIHVVPRRILAARNPGEFDYAEYMALQHVFYQAYVPAGTWQLLGRKSNRGIRGFAWDLRNYFTKRLEQVITSEDRLGVARAILLGDDALMNEDIRNSYTGAGAMHILCVSGLHVGVVYLLLNSLLFFLRGRPALRVARVVLLLGFIWLYAMVTGLSPSVMRASTMLTFIISGQLMSRKPNIYNSLAASVIFLLLIDPAYLFSLGFRLSYLAVLSIVSVQPLLYTLVHFRYHLPDRIWALITVSIAAQFGTAPLAALYFHQFPVYFIVTNLVAIPLSAVVIYSGFAFLMLSFSAWGALVPGYLLDKGLAVLNYSMDMIMGWPGSAVTGINLTGGMCFFIYGIFFLVVLWVYSGKRCLRPCILVCIIAFMVVFTHRRHSGFKQQKAIIYAVRGHTAVDVLSGRAHTVFADSLLFHQEALVRRNLKPSWRQHLLKDPEWVVLTQEGASSETMPGVLFKNGVICAGRQRIFSGPVWTRYHPVSPKPVADYLLAGNLPVYSLARLTKTLHLKTVILDGSMPGYRRSEWRQACDSLGITCRDVMEEGAVVVEF